MKKQLSIIVCLVFLSAQAEPMKRKAFTEGMLRSEDDIHALCARGQEAFETVLNSHTLREHLGKFVWIKDCDARDQGYVFGYLNPNLVTIAYEFRPLVGALETQQEIAFTRELLRQRNFVIARTHSSELQEAHDRITKNGDRISWVKTSYILEKLGEVLGTPGVRYVVSVGTTRCPFR